MSGAPLRILGFSTSDSEGGSARSARRIHRSLRALGHQSRLLVGSRVEDDTDVDTTHGGGVGRLADRIAEELTGRVGLQYQFYPSSRRVLAHPWLNDADAIQIYNTHGGYLTHRLLPRLAARAPVVWRLSDMWPVTGHCVYSGECQRWRTGCGQCPDLASFAPLPFDFTAPLWRQKRRLYATARPTIVAPSRWIEQVARQSPLLRGCDVHHVPNGVDLETYRPIPRAAARQVLGLDPEAHIVLFTAHAIDHNPRKGDRQAIEALSRLAGTPGLTVLLLGVGGEAFAAAVPQPCVRLGFVRDERLLAAVYSAADLLLAPARVENLPNSLLEAMACGCPVVAFDVGGVSDAVTHLETGYLVPPGEVEGLVQGLRLGIGDDAVRERWRAAARQRIVRDFDAKIEASRFATIYADTIAARVAH
jgi:glycosyltransferase involved in cell wall biosynthesis